MDVLATEYNIKRCDFGRQPLFCETKAELIDSIDPDKADQKEYGLRNPVDSASQVSNPISEHEINTDRIEIKAHGMNHTEGGWPKEVNHKNEEETVRYRKRIERDDHYVHAITTLAPKFEYFIRQNNAIDIYQQFFKDIEETAPVEKHSVKVKNMFRDPQKRPIADLSWTNEEDTKIAVCYCDKRYPVGGPANNILTCNLWNLENPDSPASEFYPPSACWKLACSPGNPAIILGGLEDGTVCVFDRRADREPTAVSPPHTAHLAPVSALLFIQSRINTEFFTGSSDGQCMWYDLRYLSAPMDSLIMCLDVSKGGSLSNSDGVSALQFERAFPTRFLCGTETGQVFNINRRGKTPHEVMSLPFKAHLGPVRAVHRSPCTSKMFITCGDWTTHIWSDDIRSSPIITGMPHRHQVMDVAWAPNRYSGYMTVAVDGKIRYWDLLRRYRKPMVSMVISKYPLYRIVPHEEGHLVAVGGKSGKLFLLSFSEDLVSSGDKDKQIVIQTYERETHRNHILESRVKEIRLKMRTEEEAEAEPEPPYDEEAAIRAAEEEYRKNVLDEFRRAGIPVTNASTSTKQDTMRHR